MPATTYCTVCKIGTLDAQGLCVLCGAPAHDLRGWRLAVATVVEASAAATSLPVLAGAFLFGVLALYVALVRSGARAPVLPQSRGLRALLMADPAATLSTMHGDPGGVLLRMLVPALIQALLFGLLLMIVIFILRRRRASRPREA